MTTLKQKAEEYANFQCGLYNKRGLHPEQQPYWDYHYQGFLAGAEAGFKAARLAKNGCNVSLDYNEGGGPVYPSIVDFMKDGGEGE